MQTFGTAQCTQLLPAEQLQRYVVMLTRGDGALFLRKRAKSTVS